LRPGPGGRGQRVIGVRRLRGVADAVGRGQDRAVQSDDQEEAARPGHAEEAVAGAWIERDRKDRAVGKVTRGDTAVRAADVCPQAALVGGQVDVMGTVWRWDAGAAPVAGSLPLRI